MTKFISRWAIAISLVGAASGATPANDLLERTGERVKLFWEQFSAVTCTEELVQEKLNEKGKTAIRSYSRYDYLIVLGWNKGELLVDESRVEVEAPRKGKPSGSLLATRGFATLMFILHPDFQESYSFALPVQEPSGLMRIDFLPRSGARSPGALELKGREYPILWEGSAWIDPATASVTRIEAAWKEPPEAIGLQSLKSDVSYGPVELRAKQAYWLPTSAKVSLQSLHQTWRNEHRFTKYRLFSVDVKDEVEVPK
ncbi:MAG: hypothetical protein ABIR70_07735 [Bryobacteraceae bacterium]